MYEDRMDRLVIGMACTKDKQYLYVWYEDGSVSRMPTLKKNQMLTELHNEEVIPAIEWNNQDFLSLATNYGTRS